MWLESKNIHSNRLFRITKEIGQEAFQLKLPEGWMIHNVFNEDLLTRCREPHYQGQYMELAPSPMIINEEEEYEVEEVWKHKKQKRGIQYLVYWKGYRDKHDQWIAEMGLSYAKEAIEDYWSRISSQNL